MLALLRNHSRSWLIWAIFIVLILVFIFFFGPQTEGFAPGSRSLAVRAPGAAIYDTQLNATLQRSLDRQGTRARLDDVTFHQRRRQIALDLALVHSLADRAERAGLSIGQNEVRCYVVNWNRDYLWRGVPICEDFPEIYPSLYPNLDFPFYADFDGRFSESFRQDIRGRFAMSVEEYEAWKARELLALRYVDTLATAVRVPPGAVRAAWERRNDRVSLELIPLRPDQADVSPTEAEIADAIALRESDLRALYDADPARFEVPRSARLQRIFLRKPMGGDDEALDALRERANALLAEARAPGADFDALVAEHTDLTAERETGGDMGERTADSLDSTLWEAIRDLGEGGITLVEQTSAISILRVAANTPARTLPFDDVSRELAEELLREAAVERASDTLAARGERILALAIEQRTTLQDAAALEAVELSGEDPEAEIGVLAATVTESFARERSPQRFDDLGPQFAGFTLPASPPDEIPGVGRSAELARIAFSLTAEQPVHPSPVVVNDVAYLVRLDSREQPGDSPSASDLAAVENELRDALVEAVVGPSAFRNRVLLNANDTALAPTIAAVLEEDIAARRIRLRERVFRVDPALDDAP